MKKTIKIICIILVAILLLAALAIGGFNLYIHVSCVDFYDAAEKEFKVPGISDGLIEQGFFGTGDHNILVCGYMNDGSASRVYYLDGEGEVVTYVKLYKDGEPNTGHAGGLCNIGNTVIVRASGGLDLYSLDDISAAEKGSAVEPIGFCPLPFSPAFCYSDGICFITGEFYREQNYPTDPSHHMTMPSGELHHAIALVADVAQMQNDGFKTIIPTAVLSIPDLAQGMASDGKGTLCVSTSYAVALSHLYFYDDPTSGSPDGEIEIDGAKYPLYYLDTDELQKDVTLYPMSEEIYFSNGRVFIINESASAKYIFGKLTGGGYVYSYKYGD